MTTDAQITLLDLKPGDGGVVKGFAPGNADYRRRLMAMGLTPGTRFTVTRLAPLGDPIQLQVRNSALTRPDVRFWFAFGVYLSCLSGVFRADIFVSTYGDFHRRSDRQSQLR